MTNATLREKPDAGNPHVRFEEREVAPGNPRRGSRLDTAGNGNGRKVRLGITACAALLAAGACSAANTWYVDDDNYGKSGLDGSTAATAYGTIQDAIDAATTLAGDTIKVLPGTYDKGVVTNGLFRSRVQFSKKLDIVATGTKDETHIVGRKTFGEPGDDGIGDGTNAVRCVYVASAGVGSTLTGFTLRDGATMTGATAENNRYLVSYGGGAIGVYGSGTKKTRTETGTSFYAIDCIISNNVCWYSGAAAYGGTLYRCQILDNRSGGNYSSIAFGSALFSLFARNTSCCVAGLGGSHYLGLYATLVNCTVAENKHPRAGGYNCLYTANGSMQYESAGADSSTLTTTNALVTVMAPLLGDYRPIAGSPAVDYGETKYLTTEAKVVLPEGLALRDLAGDLVATDSEKITVGAYQTPVTPPYGGLVLPKGVSVNGVATVSETNVVIYPSTWPVQYCVTGDAEDGCRLVSSADSADSPAVRQYPDEAGCYYLTPPFAAGVLQTNTYGTTSSSKSVAAGETAALENHLLTKYNPGVTIRVPAGEYGVATNSPLRRGVTNCISRAGTYFYLLVAPDGPEKTIIRGRAASSERNAAGYPGCGSDAVRCVEHNYTPDYASTLCLKGFTIADGHTDCGQDKEDDRGGAAYGRNKDNGKMRQTSLYFVDCIFTNCWAPDAGVGVNATFVRCKFIACGSAGTGFDNCILSSCVFENCDFKGGTFGANCRAINCTDASGLAVSTTASGIYLLNSHIADAAIPASAVNFGTSADGIFADLARGDLRPFNGTPSVDATRRAFPTAEDYATCAEWFAAFATSDAAGNGWTFGGGFPLAGAYQDCGRGILLETDAPYGFSVAGASAGVNLLTVGESLTISRDPDAVRHCGIVVGGVTNMLDGGATYTYAETGTGDLTAGRITGIIDPNWYVNANEDPEVGAVGSDANDGFTAATPKLTLKGVLSVATNAGDVVHAAEGIYNRETMTPLEDAPTIKIRAVVAPDVTLLGAGAESTFIQGEKAEDETATRGVYLGAGARLVDFTVCNCATTNGVNGAAVISSGYTGAVVADCIISNNVAYGAAGTYNVNYILRTRYYGNSSNRASGDSLGVCAQFGRFFNCLFDQNSGDSWLYNDIRTYNCTFGNLGSGKSQRKGSSYNTLSYRVPRDGVSMYSCYGSVSPTRTVYPDEKTVFTNEEALAYVDTTDYTPIIGANIAIDQAEMTDYANNYPTARDPKGEAGMWLDLLGNPRVSNGAMDVGAVEADYSSVYAKIIGGRRCFVTSASPAVTLGEEGKTVLIPPDAALTATWEGRLGKESAYHLGFRVTGSGTLSVTVNGETRAYTAANGRVSWDFSSTLYENQIAFSYAGDDGAAEILQGHLMNGLVILVH